MILRLVGGTRDEIDRMFFDELAEEYAEALRLHDWGI